MTAVHAPYFDGAKLDVRIPGLSIEAEIGSGAESIVYRARRQNELYAVKVRRSALSQAAREQFTKEVAAIARVRHPGIVEIHAQGITLGRGYIVMDLVSGLSLAERLLEPLSEAEVLVIARSLASALGEVHRHGLTHRDIKPSNIILDEIGRPRLIDFGLAKRAETTVANGATVGTFEYSAPEQTGVLRRPIDARSDLYALGVVLFECVVGSRPFAAEDAGDLIHQHATARPPSVLDFKPQTSPALAAIIAKLLEKDPDDRYQTAQGLLFDLEGLAELDASIRSGQTPLLGSYDLVLQEDELTPLVGREAELETMKRCPERLRDGKGSFVLLEGEPGSGKSRLTREFMRAVRADVGIVLAAKCMENAVFPYAPLREAFDGLARQVRAMPAAARQKVEAALREVGRLHGGPITRLSSSLAEYVEGDDPSSVSSSPEQFAAAIADSLSTIASASGGIVLFIDDVQWIDEGTLSVLKRLSSRLHEERVLLLTSARNDPASIPHLRHFEQKIGDAVKNRIRLRPLEREALSALVTHHLGGRPVDSRFVEQVAARSGGNPFAVGEYVRAAIDEGVLQPEWGRWSIHGSGLDRLDLPQDVIALVVRRIDSLQPETREILIAGAFLGTEVRPELLASMLQTELDSVHAAIAESARSNLLERSGRDEYAFVHDRVREALLSIPDDSRRLQLHALAAQALELSRDERSGTVMALARHYAQLGDAGDAERALAAASHAAKKALEMYSDPEAYAFLQQAAAAAQRLGVELAVPSLVELGQVCMRLGKLDESLTAFHGALSRAQEPLLRAQIFGMLARVHLANSDTEEAEACVRQGLDAAGKPLARNVVVRVLSVFLAWILSLVTRPKALDQHRRARTQILAELYDIGTYIGYFTLDNLKFGEYAIRAARPGRLLGASAERVLCDNTYGIFVGSALLPKIARKYHDRAIATAEQIGDRALLGKSHAYRAWSTAFSGMISKERELLQEIIDTGLVEWMDINDYLLTNGALLWNLEMRGKTLEAAPRMEQVLRRVRGANASGAGGDIDEKNAHVVYQIHIAAALGRAPEAAEYLRSCLAIAKERPEDVGRIGFLLPEIVWYHLELGELGEPLEEAIRLFRAMNLHPMLTPYHIKFFFVIQAYARLEQAMQPGAKSEALERLREAVRELKLAANVPIYKCHLQVLEGAYARLRGQDRRALRLLEKADRIAREIDCPWVTYEAARQRAHLWKKQGNVAASMEQASVARSLADRQGWVMKQRQVRSEFGDGRTSPVSTYATSAQSSTFDAILIKRRLDALLQVSLSAASELQPEAQARVVLDETIRLMRAERAFFFMVSEPGNALELCCGRDAESTDLEALSGYSRTVVEHVRTTGEALIVSGTEEGAVLGSQSVVAHDLRSIIAAPVKVSDRFVGVLYLDSRVAKGIFGEADKEMLEAIAGQLAVSQEMARNARLEIRRQEIERDIALTGTVQTFFLPKDGSTRVGPVALSGVYQPAAQCSGDWWAHESATQSEYDILLGDVTGHGVASAMVTAAVAGCYRAMRENERNLDHGVLLEQLDRLIQGLSAEQYGMTMGALRLNLHSGKVCWWNAGGPPLLVLSREGTLTPRSFPSAPLGRGSGNYEASEFVLEKGARLVLFTDGVFEMANATGRQLGMRRFSNMVKRVNKLPAQEAIERLKSELAEYRGSHPLEDDLTLVMIDYAR